MNRTLWKKSLHEVRWLLAGCAAVLYVFCWVRVWLTSQLDMSRFEAMLGLVPEHMKDLLPVSLEHLATYTGRIAMAYDDPLVVLVITVWAIGRGSDAVSGPLERGTMEMVLAQPVSRLGVLFSQASVTVVGTALLVLAAWAGTCTGIATISINEPPPALAITVPLGPFSFDIPLPAGQREPLRVPMSDKAQGRDFLPAVANLFALGFFLAGLSTLVSSWDRYRWRTIGIVAGIYIVQMIFKAIGLAAPGWQWLLDMTFFTAFEPEAFVDIAVNSPQDAWALLITDEQHIYTELGPLGYDMILITLGLAGYIAAAVTFSRRDLPAPL